MATQNSSLLVTTALERTWGREEPLLFLGDWCRLYDRKDAWSRRRHSVVPYHWDDRAKNRNDHAYLKGLHDALLTELAEAMNRRHGLDRPRRYWQMVLDPWLLTYVPVLWDRWECLRTAFDCDVRLETIALASAGAPKPCFDYADFVEKALNDRWNHGLYADILRTGYSGRCAITEAPDDPSSSKVLYAVAGSAPRPRSLKRRLAGAAEDALGLLASRSDAVFYESFFPNAALVRLNLALRQPPRLHLNDFEWPAALDAAPESRDGLRLALEPKNAFETFLFGRLFGDMPYAYLEGFASLLAKTRAIRMKPKVILTANAHWHNELFKLWSAEKVLGGARFVAMQHGGSIPPAFNTMEFEEDISDVKTVWTIPFHPKHERLPANKLATVKIESSREHLAVVGLEVPRYSFRVEAAPVAGQGLTSCDLSCELFTRLSEEVRDRFRVKPFPNIGWNTRQRYIDRLGADKVSEERNYYRFLSRARIIVCTYPQTTFAEAMASGLPSTLLYSAPLWETIPEFEPLVETMRKAKIVFHDPAQAAAHLDAVWADPSAWWESPEVLHARAEFKRLALNLDGDWLSPWAAFVNGLRAR